jgi:hypothetical protein
VPIAILASVGDAEDAQETLEWRKAAIEHIVRDISRGRLRIPAHVQ